MEFLVDRLTESGLKRLYSQIIEIYRARNFLARKNQIGHTLEDTPRADDDSIDLSVRRRW